MTTAVTTAPPPATPAPVPPATADAASAHLEHRLVSRWDDLLGSLTNSNFYMELTLVVLALALGWLVAKYLRKKIEGRLAIAPPKRIDIEFITKPLRLLGPVMPIPFLWGVQAFVTQMGIGGNLTNAVLHLCYAWVLVKCVMMAVRQRAVAGLISLAIIINAILHATRVARSVSGWLESIAFDAGQFHLTALHLVNGLVIFVAVFWGAGVLSSALESYLHRSTRLSATTRHLIVKFFRVFVYILALMITLTAVGIDLTAFAIFSGALGVGIGLGLQKVTSNFVSGVTMLMERSIKIGDLIEISGVTGWVRQLNIRYALLETSDGREVIIPNEELFSSRVVNWTLTTTLARIEIKVTIAFDSDAEKARDLMLASVVEHPLCLKDPKPACLIREFTGTGVEFALSFWIANIAEGRNAPKSEVMFLILKKFSQNGIVLAKG